MVTMSFWSCPLGLPMLQLPSIHAWTTPSGHSYVSFLLVFFDDILVYSKTWEEHLKHLDETLSILEEQSLYVKMSKCEFGMKEMLYLGHIINEEGVQVDMEKIRAIRDWPTPKTITELRGFLGLCTYYRRYVKGFSQFVAPLTDLTKKGAFTWRQN